MNDEKDAEIEVYGEPVTGEYSTAPPMRSTSVIVDSMTGLFEAMTYGQSTKQVEREFRASLLASRQRRAKARVSRVRSIVLIVSIEVLIAGILVILAFTDLL